jgi:hypothetical protein
LTDKIRFSGKKMTFSKKAESQKVSDIGGGLPISGGCVPLIL